MLNNNYANAYKEVLAVLNNLTKEDYEKIPNEYIDFFEKNCNNDYQFKYDVLKKFNEQVLLEETRYILFGIFERFGATEKQKNDIKNFKKYYYNKIEELKKEKYDADKLFENKQVVNEKIENAIVEYKEKNIFETIIDKIKNFFRRRL